MDEHFRRHFDIHFANRPGRRGFAFAKGLGGGGQGLFGGGFPAGRFVGDGELRLLVLALLAEQPRHGYDVIKALEERSNGFYSPSPGVVYPTLTYLEEAGHAVSAADGNRKIFSITDAGRAHLAENREAVEAVLARLGWVGERMAKARSWFDWGKERLNAAMGSPLEGDDEGEYAPTRPGADRAPPDRDIPNVLPEVNAARRALKTAIAEKLGVGTEQQRRMAAILNRAAEEITALEQGAPEADVDL